VWRALKTLNLSDKAGNAEAKKIKKNTCLHFHDSRFIYSSGYRVRRFLKHPQQPVLVAFGVSDDSGCAGQAVV
jgi:hypothetical protein